MATTDVVSMMLVAVITIPVNGTTMVEDMVALTVASTGIAVLTVIVKVSEEVLFTGTGDNVIVMKLVGTCDSDTVVANIVMSMGVILALNSTLVYTSEDEGDVVFIGAAVFK